MHVAIIALLMALPSADGLFRNRLNARGSEMANATTSWSSFLQLVGKTLEDSAEGIYRHTFASEDNEVVNETEAATFKRMIYWHVATAPKPTADKYLLFEFDQGGLNNIRIGWEYSGIIAQLTGRTLVLPPPKPMYLLDYGPRNKKYLPKKGMQAGKTITAMEDLVNMNQLRGNLPVLSAAEFEEQTGLSWSKAKAKAGKLEDGAKAHGLDQKALDCNNVPEYKSIKAEFLHMVTPGGHREGFFCGEWWKQGGPKDTLKKYMSDPEWALLTHGFVWHDDAFAIASKAVSYMGLFDYVAIHARYGDFVEKQTQQGPKQLLKNWAEYLPAGAVLYIATDDPGKFEGQAPAGVKLIMWDDLFTKATGELLADTKAKYTPERWFKLIGLVEELICTYSKIFIGTARSSFTGHIQRMRIHAGAPTMELINHKDGMTAKAQHPEDFPQVESDIELWTEQRKNYTYKPLDINHGSLFIETDSSDASDKLMRKA